MDKEPRIRLRNVVMFIVILVSLPFCGLVIVRFFGICATWLTCAIFSTSFLLWSWFSDREYRIRVRESTYTRLGWILLIIVLWIAAFAWCTE